MKLVQLTLAALSLGGLASPAAAQSFDNTGRAAPVGARVQLGVVIPLGEGGTTAERAPRLEIWNDNRSLHDLPQASLRSDLQPPVVRPIRVGINFSGDPRFMINGREIPEQDDRKGISTEVAIGIGVAVVVAIVVVAASGTEVTLTN